MLRGLQTHFNGRVDLNTLKFLRDTLHVDLCRIDAMSSDVRTMIQMVNDAQAAHLTPLVIVGSSVQVENLPEGCYAEYLNEPDGDITPEDYREGMMHCYDAATRRGIVMCGPAISNLLPPRIAFAEEALRAVPFDIVATCHRYSPDESQPWDLAHRPFGSRAKEIEAFRAAVGARRKFGVTEFGYSTGKFRPHWWSVKRIRVADPVQADKIREEFKFYESMGAEFAVLYQLNDGPTENAIDQFGIRDRKGVYKVQSRTFITSRR